MSASDLRAYKSAKARNAASSSSPILARSGFAKRYAYPQYGRLLEGLGERGGAAGEFNAALVRVDTELAGEAMKLMGAKSRTEVIHMALEWATDTQRFQKLMDEYGGKLKFEGVDEGDGASVTG